MKETREICFSLFIEDRTFWITTVCMATGTYSIFPSGAGKKPALTDSFSDNS